MTLDQSSRRNLEISESISGQGRSNTLLTVLDNTVTPMGARLLKNWMQQPLLEKEAIIERLDLTESMFIYPEIRSELMLKLKSVSDMEISCRIYSKLNERLC